MPTDCGNPECHICHASTTAPATTRTYTSEEAKAVSRPLPKSTSPGKPTRRRSSRSMRVAQGITDKAEIWLMPKDAMPPHRRYHPRWLFFKQHRYEEYAIAEYLVYQVFEIIEPGLCPTVYLINDGDAPASLMRWVGRSAKASKHARVNDYTDGHALRPREVKDFAIIGVIDALTNNSDRHGGNMLRMYGRLIPIDHGLAFYTSHPDGDVRGRMRHLLPKHHRTLWLRHILTTLTAVSRNKARLVRILNQSEAAQSRPLTVDTLTSWVKEARRSITKELQVRA